LSRVGVAYKLWMVYNERVIMISVRCNNMSSIGDSQVAVLLFIAFSVGILALRLGRDLYR